MEAVGAVSGGAEVLLEAAGVELGLWIPFTGAVDGGIGEADDEAAEGAEQVSGVGGAHAAAVLLEGEVQGVVKAALNDPVLALALEQAPSLKLIQTQTAQQIDDFALPEAVAADPGFQAGGQTGAGEADLGRGDFPALQGADLQSAAVTLALQGVGTRRRRRGKKRFVGTAIRGFDGPSFGWP